MEIKTNLDAIYKTNEDLEVDGVWFDLNDYTGFKVARFGGRNGKKIKAATAQYYKPFARQMENGSLSIKKREEILMKTFIGACLVDWRGVEIDGKEAECTPENALKLFQSLPDLFDTLHEYANSMQSYKEDLGND